MVADAANQSGRDGTDIKHSVLIDFIEFCLARDVADNETALKQERRRRPTHGRRPCLPLRTRRRQAPHARPAKRTGRAFGAERSHRTGRATLGPLHPPTWYTANDRAAGSFLAKWRATPAPCTEGAKSGGSRGSAWISSPAFLVHGAVGPGADAERAWSRAMGDRPLDIFDPEQDWGAQSSGRRAVVDLGGWGQRESTRAKQLALG